VLDSWGKHHLTSDGTRNGSAAGVAGNNGDTDQRQCHRSWYQQQQRDIFARQVIFDIIVVIMSVDAMLATLQNYATFTLVRFKPSFSAVAEPQRTAGNRKYRE